MAYFENQYVMFVVSGEKYALSLSNVIEVVKTTEITEVPMALNFVEGIIHLRNRVVPVIDLRKRFGLTVNSDENQTKGFKIIISKVHDKHVGFIVDDVLKVVVINEEDIEETTTGHSNNRAFVKGVAKLGEELIVVVDTNELLTTNEVGEIANL